VLIGALETPSQAASSITVPGRTALTQLVLADPDDADADAGPDSAGEAGPFDAAFAATQQALLLAERITAARAGTGLVGACGPFAPHERLALESAGERCELAAPPPPAHLSAAGCSARAAARDDYPFPETIELELTDEALALHDAYAEAENEDDFPVRVVLGQGAAIEGRAHFRGQTSLACARKNYSVNLAGAEARRLMPGFADDEFYLISMCKERYYYRQVLASEMMRAFGLFPLERRYVRLRVAGRDLGVYLLLEKPHEALRNDQAELFAVVRRRLDTDGKKPESKYPDPADAPEQAAAALAAYRELAAIVDAEAPTDLYDALSSRLDFDAYLRWMAITTYLQCGDYVDETFFYASAELGTPGSGHYFRNLGWDTDDLFTSCHHRGEFAYVDPYDIVYCAEGFLDRALFVSDDVYARFIGELERLMTGSFPPDTVREVARDVREALFRLLQDEDVCAAMIEIAAAHAEATSCEHVRSLIAADMESFEQMTRDRAALLQGKIAAWRAAQ
jgi:hypothetical protein